MNRWRIGLGGQNRFRLLALASADAPHRRQLVLSQVRTYICSLRGVEVSALWTLDVHNEPLERMVLLLDPELQLVSARSGDSPIPWSAGPTAADAPTRVTLRFPEAIRQGKRIIRLSALGRPVLDSPWRLPRNSSRGPVLAGRRHHAAGFRAAAGRSSRALECGQTAAGPLSAPRRASRCSSNRSARGHGRGLAFAPSRKGPPWRKKRAKCRYFCGQHGSTTVGLGVGLPVNRGIRPNETESRHVAASPSYSTPGHEGLRLTLPRRNRPQRSLPRRLARWVIRQRGTARRQRRADAFAWNFPPIGKWHIMKSNGPPADAPLGSGRPAGVPAAGTQSAGPLAALECAGLRAWAPWGLSLRMSWPAEQIWTAYSTSH